MSPLLLWYLISPTAGPLKKRKRRELQKLSNILLSSMTIIETLVGGICVPLSATHGLTLPHQILTPQHIFTLHVATGFLRDHFSGECTKSKNLQLTKIGKNINHHTSFRDTLQWIIKGGIIFFLKYFFFHKIFEKCNDGYRP